MNPCQVVRILPCGTMPLHVNLTLGSHGDLLPQISQQLNAPDTTPRAKSPTQIIESLSQVFVLKVGLLEHIAEGNMRKNRMQQTLRCIHRQVPVSFGLYPDQILCLELSLHGNTLQKACIRAHHRDTGQSEEKGSLVAHSLENASSQSTLCRAYGIQPASHAGV